MQISKGQVCPILNPNQGQDGNVFIMDGPGFSILTWLSNPTVTEIAAWNSGGYVYGAFVEDSVPFFLASFEDSGVIAEASINVLAEMEKGEFHCDFLAGESSFMNLFLVDAHTNIVHGIRVLGMGSTTANALRTACAEQVEQYESGKDVATKIMALMQKYSPTEMLQKTQMFRPG